MDDTLLRSYRPRDQDLVEHFFEEAWRSTRFPFNPLESHSDLRHIPATYQTNGGGFWVLWISDRIAGTVAVRRLPENVAEVKRLNVLTPYRRRGYGDRLLRHALSHAGLKGFRAARLDTIRNQGPAVRLFEEFGFAPIPRYNSNPDANLFMEMVFSDPVPARHG